MAPNLPKEDSPFKILIISHDPKDHDEIISDFRRKSVNAQNVEHFGHPTSEGPLGPERGGSVHARREVAKFVKQIWLPDISRWPGQKSWRSQLFRPSRGVAVRSCRTRGFGEAKSSGS